MPDYEAPPPPPPEMESMRCQAVRDMGLDLESEEPSIDFITQICNDIFQVGIHLQNGWRRMGKRRMGLAVQTDSHNLMEANHGEAG